MNQSPKVSGKIIDTFTKFSDGKPTHEIASNQSFWVDTEKTKKPKNVQDKKKVDVKTEKSKNSTNLHCNCLTRNDKKTERKVKPEIKQEKDGSDMIKKCNILNHIFSNDKCKADKCCGCKEFPNAKDATSDKLLRENISELDEKIEFLTRLFECHVRKASGDDFMEKMQMKAACSAFGDFWQLFSINKRICAAEEGIEKLTLMVEELCAIVESIKKKDSAWNEDETIFSNSFDFEEMTIMQKLEFLKKRNDLLTNFMKCFLGINSLEDISSKLDLAPKENESNQTMVKVKLHAGGTDPSSMLSRELMKTIGIQVSDHYLQRNSQLIEGQNSSRSERREEHGVKYSGNKLDVISEQSEFVTNRKTQEGKRQDEIQKNHNSNTSKNMKGKFSQVCDTNDLKDIKAGLTEATSRLLAQEAILKSSLDKVQYELLSNLDPTEKNFLRDNLILINKIQLSEKEDNSCDVESHSETLSDISIILVESDNDAKSFNDNLSRSSNTFDIKKDNREEVVKFINTLIPSRSKSRKRSEDNGEPRKNKYSKHISSRSSTSLTSPQKTSRISRYVPESCSSLQDRRKATATGIQPRPYTEPSGRRTTKMTPKNFLKPLIQAESPKRNSGINSSLKNKNKILLSKKSFVRTS